MSFLICKDNTANLAVGRLALTAFAIYTAWRLAFLIKGRVVASEARGWEMLLREDHSMNRNGSL